MSESKVKQRRTLVFTNVEKNSAPVSQKVLYTYKMINYTVKKDTMK